MSRASWDCLGNCTHVGSAPRISKSICSERRLRLVVAMNSGGGYAARIMRLIGSWGRRNLTVTCGRKGGGLDGRMAGVVD